jgi:hypothetical protein
MNLACAAGSRVKPFEDGNQRELCMKIQFVPRNKHTVSVIKTRQLMLYREIIAAGSEIHTKHINTLCGAERRNFILLT